MSYLKRFFRWLFGIKTVQPVEFLVLHGNRRVQAIQRCLAMENLRIDPSVTTRDAYDSELLDLIEEIRNIPAPTAPIFVRYRKRRKSK